jgi:ligand-binding sensor domain-containing protein/serine phosphatase RsbU (regulator of sigma subunit)
MDKVNLLIKSCKIFTAVLIVFLFQSSFVFAQQSKNITVINNQRNIDFNCVLQDDHGLIWFGTDKGLIRYDGEKYKVFENINGLVKSPITAIFKDKKGILWIGHANGKVSTLKNEKFEEFIKNQNLRNYSVSSIIEQQGIWIGTYGDGVYRYNRNNELVHYDVEQGIADNTVYTLCIDKSNNVWAGSDGGLTRFVIEQAKVSMKVVSMKKGLPDNIVRNISLAESGELVIAMQDSGICLYNVQTNTFKKCTRWKYGTVKNIIEYEPQVFYLATEKYGIVKCINSSLKLDGISKLSYTQGIDTRNLNLLFKDRENNLWFLKKSGLTLMSWSRWNLYQNSNGLRADTILSILIDKKNNCWVGSNKGLQIYSFPSYYDNIPTSLTFVEQVFDKEVTCIYEDTFGNIWFGTYGFGLYKYNLKSKKLSSIPLKTEFENDNISCITVDNHQKIWVATLGGGISVIEYNKDKDTETVKNFGTNEGLLAIYIYSILCDSENLRWVGTDGSGLVEYTAGLFIKVNEKSHIDAKSVYSIIKSHAGNVWFNMSENGLYRFDGKEIINFNTQNGLTDNNPLSIASYKEQVLAIHNLGIDVYNERLKLFKYYNFNDLEVEPNLNANFVDKKGNIWIGTNKGLILFRCGELMSDTIAPIVSISSLLVQNKPYSLKTDHSFSSANNNLIFNFNAVWYRIGEKIKYKYKLEGADKNYIITENKTVSYAGLQPGNYTFYLYAANSEGQWSKPVTYNFIIKKPIWQLWWVWFIGLIVIYFSIYFALRYRLNLLKREKKILEHKVQLRTQEIVNQSKIIEAKNKDITDSIEYAKKIQDSILPSIESIKKSLPESFIFYQQKDIVSGDFYWFSQKKHITIIAAVDCTGHGVPGAFMSLIGNNILNQIINENNITDPAIILNYLNEGVNKALYTSKTYGVAKDGMDIGICAINSNANEIIYAGAMRPIYITREGKLDEIAGDKVAIGTDFSNGIHKDFKFNNKKIEVQTGDIFYLSTDGYADQFGGEKGKKMMKKNFKNLLQHISHKPMAQQEIIVAESFSEWKGNFEQVDDVLVIGFKL